MSGFEKNRNSLNDALGRMRNYDAPADLWSKIEEGVNEPGKVDDLPLQEAVEQLPLHSPPVDVWNQLNKTLDNTKEAKRVQLGRRRQWLALAAAVAMVLSAAAWVFREPPPTVTFQYAEETLQQFRLDIDWRLDEDTFAQLEDHLNKTNDPSLNKLRLEYEELSSARVDVEDMLMSYGQDPQLVRQMADIERERTDIYRQIIELI